MTTSLRGQGNVFAISLGFSCSRAQARPSGDCFCFSKGTTNGDWISALPPFVIISYPVNHIKFEKFPFLLLLGGCSIVIAFPISALGNHTVSRNYGADAW